MTDPILQEIEELFHRVCDLEPSEREAILADECEATPELRAAVERLIGNDPGAERLHEAPHGPRVPVRVSPGDIPEFVGPFRVLSRLGIGGMGEVYEAEQESPARRVAVKVLRAAFPGDQAHGRFRLEAEILGALQHPNIVQVFHADLDGGDPFFAMELVDGPDLMTHARVESLDIEGRLTILAEVCDAVHYAHQQGVVHRDLKPSNIIVDGSGRPRILDFGIARILGPDRGLSLTGQVFGTLDYMSPEQRGEGDGKVDTRTDVYALGVIAYELLAGRRPLDTTGLSVHQALQKLARTPLPPLSSMDSTLSGDLETIVAKALALEPDARYGAASQLADDLRRFLRHEPIDARRPTFRYLLARFARRNRALTIALALGGLAMIGGGTGTGIGFLRATHNARVALERLEQVTHLGNSGRLRELERRAEQLFPARPRLIPAYERWLSAARVLANDIESSLPALLKLRERALPPTAEEGRVDRGEHPEAPALEAARRRIAVLRARLAGGPPWPERGDEEILAPEPGTVEERLRAELARDEALVEELSAAIEQRRTHTFEDPRDAARHEVMTFVASELDGLRVLITDVEKRLEFARTIEERSVTGDAAAAAWDEACAAIADPERCPAYEGLLRIRPQLGLLPLGRDARSGLYEFLHVESGLAPPRSARGGWEMGEDSGVVLVLIPGGTFFMGAQRIDPFGANFDEDSNQAERPVHRLQLGAFFLSKYELTMGQWKLVTQHNPSQWGPRYRPGGVQHDLTHPVERVSWNECMRVLGRLGLTLPTEAQWEYAARAGTLGPWWTGTTASSVNGVVNLADAAAERVGADWPAIDPAFEDGFPAHSPVGHFPPNPFGLHDVAGNVWEWCLDSEEDYTWPARPDDGLRLELSHGARCYRGGSYYDDAESARTTNRDNADPRYVDMAVGVRPARFLDVE